HLVKVVFPQFESIIIERTTKKPLYVSAACFDYAKEFAEQQLTPFYEHFKKHIEAVDATIRKEVAEYKQIFDDLDAEYEHCVLENKNLKIEKKKLLIKSDSLIAECLEKDICYIVLSSNLVMPPSLDSLNCTLAKLRTNYDREHSKVLELEAEVLKRQNMITESEKGCAFLENEHVNLQLKFQNYKECLQIQKCCDSSNYTTSNVIFEINKLKDQLQGKDETIRNLQAQHDIVSLLNVGPTDGRKALETELTQLKDTITALRIQNDGFKVTNATQKTKIAKLKAKDVGNKSSGTITPTNLKVLASRMYAIGPKYIIPHRRTNRETPIPMSWKKHVTFKEPPKPSPRVTKKPVAPQVKKANATSNRQTTKKVWKQKVFAHAKPQWMPTGRHFTLYDSYPLTRILDPMEEPLELSPSISSSLNVTMLSRSQGRTVADSYAETSKDQEYFIMNLDRVDIVKKTLEFGARGVEWGEEANTHESPLLRSFDPYAIMEKELLDLVFAFDKFRQHLVLSKTIIFTDHSALVYLFTKQDAKPQLIRWILLLQSFDIEICDKKGSYNLADDHFYWFENPNLGKLIRVDIQDLFLEERLMLISDEKEEPWYADFTNYLASKEIHVTWAQLEKKRDKDATLQDFDEALIYSAWRRHCKSSLTPLKLEGDDVTILFDVVTVAKLEEAHGRFSGLTSSQLTSDDVATYSLYIQTLIFIVLGGKTYNIYGAAIVVEF
nr:reverse transcriptase domain-containing protein [Tanacetum cinerariifolium]